MNIPINHEHLARTSPDAWGLARLELLDAFFHFELQVGKWCQKIGKCDVKTSLGSKLDALSGHQSLESVATTRQVEYLRGLRELCREPLRIRNAIVHSRVKDGLVSEQFVLFETVALALEGDGAVIPLSLKEVKAAAAEIRNISGRLNLFLTQNKGS
ncbi:hypothetical protein [Tsuneonella sp. SYSU-LHT278]|uniref:hypothetical protein n=1 Tax=Tsuneonella sediminis TaxID=3416089 RepID=UPI003F7973D9